MTGNENGRKDFRVPRQTLAKERRLAAQAHLAEWVDAAGLNAYTVGVGSDASPSLIAKWMRCENGTSAKRLLPLRQNIANALGVPLEDVELSTPPSSGLTAIAESDVNPPLHEEEGVGQPMSIEVTPLLLRRMQELIDSNLQLNAAITALIKHQVDPSATPRTPEDERVEAALRRILRTG